MEAAQEARSERLPPTWIANPLCPQFSKRCEESNVSEAEVKAMSAVEAMKRLCLTVTEFKNLCESSNISSWANRQLTVESHVDEECFPSRSVLTTTFPSVDKKRSSLDNSPISCCDSRPSGSQEAVGCKRKAEETDEGTNKRQQQHNESTAPQHAFSLQSALKGGSLLSWSFPKTCETGPTEPQTPSESSGNPTRMQIDTPNRQNSVSLRASTPTADEPVVPWSDKPLISPQEPHHSQMVSQSVSPTPASPPTEQEDQDHTLLDIDDTALRTTTAITPEDFLNIAEKSPLASSDSTKDNTQTYASTTSTSPRSRGEQNSPRGARTPTSYGTYSGIVIDQAIRIPAPNFSRPLPDSIDGADIEQSDSVAYDEPTHTPGNISDILRNANRRSRSPSPTWSYRRRDYNGVRLLDIQLRVPPKRKLPKRYVPFSIESLNADPHYQRVLRHHKGLTNPTTTKKGAKHKQQRPRDTSPSTLVAMTTTINNAPTKSTVITGTHTPSQHTSLCGPPAVNSKDSHVKIGRHARLSSSTTIPLNADRDRSTQMPDAATECLDWTDLELAQHLVQKRIDLADPSRCYAVRDLCEVFHLETKPTRCARSLLREKERKESTWRFRDKKKALLSRISPDHLEYIKSHAQHAMLLRRLPARLRIQDFAERVHLLTFHFIVRDGRRPSYWDRINRRLLSTFVNCKDDCIDYSVARKAHSLITVNHMGAREAIDTSIAGVMEEAHYRHPDRPNLTTAPGPVTNTDDDADEQPTTTQPPVEAAATENSEDILLAVDAPPVTPPVQQPKSRQQPQQANTTPVRPQSAPTPPVTTTTTTTTTTSTSTTNPRPTPTNTSAQAGPRVGPSPTTPTITQTPTASSTTTTTRSQPHSSRSASTAPVPSASAPTTPTPTPTSTPIATGTTPLRVSETVNTPTPRSADVQPKAPPRRASSPIVRPRGGIPHAVLSTQFPTMPRELPVQPKSFKTVPMMMQHAYGLLGGQMMPTHPTTAQQLHALQLAAYQQQQQQQIQHQLQLRQQQFQQHQQLATVGGWPASPHPARAGTTPQVSTAPVQPVQGSKSSNDKVATEGLPQHPYQASAAGIGHQMEEANIQARLRVARTQRLQENQRQLQLRLQEAPTTALRVAGPQAAVGEHEDGQHTTNPPEAATVTPVDTQPVAASYPLNSPALQEQIQQQLHVIQHAT
eukprot:TRINITY_DN65603_c0_g1_i1.p1 TRINITY_DN65603_c0_g1~~TRINITY_DN65603_c0_g1_i1.p1  ORF type:complete len:1185 (+),score=126.73 TRINITY_DN65603_c0_g1_i1:22-3576(+)